MESRRPGFMIMHEWPEDLPTCGTVELELFLLTPSPQPDGTIRRELWARDGMYNRAYGVATFLPGSEHARSDTDWHTVRVLVMPAPGGAGIMVYALECGADTRPIRGL